MDNNFWLEIFKNIQTVYSTLDFNMWIMLLVDQKQYLIYQRNISGQCQKKIEANVFSSICPVSLESGMQYRCLH